MKDYLIDKAIKIRVRYELYIFKLFRIRSSIKQVKNSLKMLIKALFTSINKDEMYHKQLTLPKKRDYILSLLLKSNKQLHIPTEQLEREVEMIEGIMSDYTELTLTDLSIFMTHPQYKILMKEHMKRIDLLADRLPSKYKNYEFVFFEPEKIPKPRRVRIKDSNAIVKCGDDLIGDYDNKHSIVEKVR